METACAHQQTSGLKCGIHTHTYIYVMCRGILFSRKKEGHPWEFSGSPVLRVQPFHSWGLASIPGWRTKILPAMWYGQNKERKKGNPVICDNRDEPLRALC